VFSGWHRFFLSALLDPEFTTNGNKFQA
jgi:hypothetical protein